MGLIPIARNVESRAGIEGVVTDGGNCTGSSLANHPSGDPVGPLLLEHTLSANLARTSEYFLN